LNVLSEIFEMLLRILLPILIVILILLIAKIILNYLKYGTKIFSSFKKYNLSGKMRDIIIDMVKNENRKDTLIINGNENYFYAITNYAVFAIFVFDYNVPISGKINDEYLIMDGKKIKNPIPKFLNINNAIIKNEIDLEVVYINSKKECKININGFNNNICTLGSFSNQLYKNQHSLVKYSTEQVNVICKKIEDIINGNN